MSDYTLRLRVNGYLPGPTCPVVALLTYVSGILQREEQRQYDARSNATRMLRYATEPVIAAGLKDPTCVCSQAGRGRGVRADARFHLCV